MYSPTLICNPLFSKDKLLHNIWGFYICKYIPHPYLEKHLIKTGISFVADIALGKKLVYDEILFYQSLPWTCQKMWFIERHFLHIIVYI